MVHRRRKVGHEVDAKLLLYFAVTILAQNLLAVAVVPRALAGIAEDLIGLADLDETARGLLLVVGILVYRQNQRNVRGQA